MEDLTISRKKELISAINEIEDEKLINQLLFQIQPKKIIDRNWEMAISSEESIRKLKERIIKKLGK